MFLDIISNNIEVKLPEWVSTDNASYKAYNEINKTYKQKCIFIKKCKEISGLNLKGDYQITASKIATSIGISNPTLLHTSSYSDEVRKLLSHLNDKLILLKEDKIAEIKIKSNAGLKAKKKDYILDSLRQKDKELEYYKQLNATQQVDKLLSELSLPVKRKLGIDI